MTNPRITARKYLGNDGASWAVFLNGQPVVTGLTQREVPYYKRLTLKRYEETQQ